MNKLQSRKFWIVVGVLAVLLGLFAFCLIRLGSGENASLLTLAGRVIAAVEVIVLGYLGANVLAKTPWLRGGNGNSPPSAE